MCYDERKIVRAISLTSDMVYSPIPTRTFCAGLLTLYTRQRQEHRYQEKMTKMLSESSVGVILMTYGSPSTLDDIPAYLQNVRGGNPASEALITEFRRRYGLIGGSPLLRITREQAAALQEELNGHNGLRFRVVAGMRFAPPYIADVVPEATVDAQRLIGVIMSPQYSPIIMSGYVRALESAVAGLQRNDLELRIAGAWHLQPYFLQALADRVQQALMRFPPEVRERVPVL